MTYVVCPARNEQLRCPSQVAHRLGPRTSVPRALCSGLALTGQILPPSRLSRAEGSWETHGGRVTFAHWCRIRWRVFKYPQIRHRPFGGCSIGGREQQSVGVRTSDGVTAHQTWRSTPAFGLSSSARVRRSLALGTRVPLQPRATFVWGFPLAPVSPLISPGCSSRP
ncbi:hypothetical protein NDU88_007923 [Pleurodeles waltl]|uniref:Uncharacterized protein n=1 Tax=Pleurodeles waltl TaxID=8319 RepID=A0AAV7PNA5_PLEWA|nr:hypothetical protein NDU88_007923 [Pleurodeles waltl]